MENLGIQGKVTIITGASSGIGRATALSFARERAKLLLVSRNKSNLTEIAKEVENIGAEAAVFAADITKEVQIKKIINYALERFDGIDIIINSAGIIATGTIETTTLEDWDYMMNINLRSIFLLTQLALPSLIERKGNIVNVSIVTGIRAFP